MTSKLVVNTIEADTGISSVSFGSSISLSSTSKFFFGAAGIDIGADTNINRPATGVLGFNINSSEKARIDSSGRVMIGTTTEGFISGDNLTVADSGDCGISIRSGTSNTGSLYFSRATSGSAEYSGALRYLHAHGALQFYTNGSEKFRIDSSGRIGVGVVPTAQFAHNLIQIGHQATLGANAALSTTGQTFLTHNLYFDTGGTLKVFNTSNANEGAIFRLVDGQLLFSNSTATTGTPTVVERLRIDSSGHLLLGTTTGGLTDYGDSLTIADANAGMTLRAAATNQASHIYFADGTSGDAQYRGYVQYHHNTDEMKFGTSAIERLKIQSNGDVYLNPTLGSTGVNSGAIRRFNAGLDYWSGTAGSSNAIKYAVHGQSDDNMYGIGISASLLELQSQVDIGFFAGGAGSGTGRRVERARILSTGGLTFNGDTAAANALDDYEEGTYVPSTNTGLTLNSSYNTFSYIKIGRCCTVRGLFYPNNNPSGGHTMTMSLPFASYNYTGSGASIAGAGGSGTMYRSISGADAGVAVYVSDNVSTATFYKNGSNGGAWSPVYNNDWNNAMEIYVDFTYFTV